MLKARIILTLCFIVCSFFAKATLDCLWASSGKGVTVNLVASCDQKNRLYVDSFLNQILLKLNRKDTILKILVLINDAKISYPNSNEANFISVAFDTLKRIDHNFISDYYFGKEQKSREENKGANYYRSHLNPLDINYSLSQPTKQTGIKIIYRTGDEISELNLKEIETLIQYAVTNSETIKLT